MYKKLKKSIKKILLYLLNLNKVFFVAGQKLIGLTGRITWPRKIYGQRAEDYFVEKILSGCKNKCYMDIGSYHPIVYSNTYRLYKNGWHGINVDMSPKTINIFKRFRKKDINICAALGTETSQNSVGYYLEEDGLSPLNTLDKDVAQDYIMRFGKSLTKHTISTYRLQDMFSAFSIDPKGIDFLNIDIEGLDSIILDQWPFELSKPAVICIEVQNDNINELLQTKINNTLVSNGYKMRYWVSPSVIFSLD